MAEPKEEVTNPRNCLECGVEFNCEIDNPLCLCNECYDDYMQRTTDNDKN